MTLMNLHYQGTHKRPNRYKDEISEAEFPATPKDLYRGKYFEVLDLAIMSIMERFDQSGFKK